MQELFCRWGFKSIYFVQSEWLMPFCLGHLPGQHKRPGITPSTSSLPHVLFELDRPVLSFSLKPGADNVTMRRLHLIYGQLVPWNSFYINPPRQTAPRSICSGRENSYFGLARNLIRHLISPNQDDLSYSARTFISGHQIL